MPRYARTLKYLFCKSKVSSAGGNYPCCNESACRQLKRFPRKRPTTTSYSRPGLLEVPFNGRYVKSNSTPNHTWVISLTSNLSQVWPIDSFGPFIVIRGMFETVSGFIHDYRFGNHRKLDASSCQYLNVLKFNFHLMATIFYDCLVLKFS